MKPLNKLADLYRKPTHLVIGLMSGTSADGVDAALCELSGKGCGALKVKLLAEHAEPYPASVRKRVLAACEPEGGLTSEICELNFLIGEVFARSANAVMKRAGVRASAVDLIGSHGQTVAHIPPQASEPRALASGPDRSLTVAARLAASTLQLGEPAVIAERTGVAVVSNFRARDMAAGGQGAPLVPFVDYLLLSSKKATRAALNIGGIANVTYLPARIRAATVRERSGPLANARGSETCGVIAYDTGPGNMIIDALVQHITGGAQAFDRDGAIAASGRVNKKLLAEMMKHEYLKRPPPKSTGREDFGTQYALKMYAKFARVAQPPSTVCIGVDACATDFIATATAFTALSISASINKFLRPKGALDELIVSGGGALNPVLMANLRRELQGMKVSTSAEYGLPVKAKECIAFAVLARETILGRSGNLPSATGAAGPRILGQITFY